MKLSEANRPLRMFDKAIQGGLGAGNLGVLMAGHGTGKVAVLTSITLDHAINGQNVLHVAIGKSVGDIRAYHDEILQEIIHKLDITDRPDLITKVERHRQIYTYRNGSFSPRRLRETLTFLANHAEFQPRFVDIQGWPNFNSFTLDELWELKNIAEESKAEMWLTAHTQREDHMDARGVPDYLCRLEKYISVLIGLEPIGDRVQLRFVKTHNAAPPSGIHLEFNPTSQLLQWR